MSRMSTWAMKINDFVDNDVYGNDEIDDDNKHVASAALVNICERDIHRK